MSQAEQSIITQVWWDGGTVDFVRWTEKSLVFCWEGARKTAVHMPRGAVVRLLDKGVLRIEGYQPEWLAPREACDSDLPPERVPPPAEKTGVPTGTARSIPPCTQLNSCEIVYLA